MKFISIFLAAVVSSTVFANTVPSPNTAGILVLSGGSSPQANHYSQYLQTRVLTLGLRNFFGPESTEVLFGAGNSEKQPSLFADVHRVSSDEKGHQFTDMVFGSIAGNMPATMQGVESWFANHADKNSDPEKNFFLFVSDHGMPNEGGGYGNNCIDLWSYDSKTLGNLSWDQECLSKNKLRDLLKENIKSKNTVFAMSQCFSGGFHQMSVQSSGGVPIANVNLCGFTAVTEDTVASGCTPDVDGPGYKGYERFFTQQLTGIDVVTGKPMPYARKTSVREAHYAAAAEDTTKDIPLSTSEYYLRVWSTIIANKKYEPRNENTNLEGAQKAFFDVYDLKVSREEAIKMAGPLSDIAADMGRHLDAQVKLINNTDPTLKAVIASGTNQQLNNRKADIISKLETVDAEIEELETVASRVYSKVLLPSWAELVKNGEKIGLTATELGIEKTLLNIELQGRSTNQVCVMLLSKFATEHEKDRYDALRSYCGKRSKFRLEALEKLSSADVKAPLQKFTTLNAQIGSLAKQQETLTRQRDFLRRIIIGRATISATVALNILGDNQAIEELQGLVSCESSPF